ncbi:hypothetical protein [Mycolicibacterium brumae]|nr:hypothetical protein [Mycolicibacterium brumae]MCV7193326.1 hypothetical protein [Mycolicibacterium brumae]
MFAMGKGLDWRLGWKDSWFADDGRGSIYSIDKVNDTSDEWEISALTGPVDARVKRDVPWPDERRGLRAAKRACELDLKG